MRGNILAPLAAAARGPYTPAPLLSTGLAAAAVLGGAFGLFCDSGRPAADLPLRLEIHLLFGLLLSLAIVDDFRRMNHQPAMPPPAPDILARRLARRVYLVLYLLAGLQLARGWADYLFRGAPFDLASVEILQPYLGCGIANLVLIRVLAAKRRRHAAETVASRGMSA